MVWKVTCVSFLRCFTASTGTGTEASIAYPRFVVDDCTSLPASENINIRDESANGQRRKLFDEMVCIEALN